MSNLWRRQRLKWCFSSCVNGVWGDDPNGYNDTPVVRVADFDRTTLRVPKVPTIRAIRDSHRASRRLTNRDLLIEKSGGGDNQPVGTVVSYDLPLDAVYSNFVARLKVVETCNPRFVTYLNSHLYANGVNVRSIKQTTGIQNLDAESYLDEYVTVPDQDTQKLIAVFLDRETSEIDKLIQHKEELLHLLREKREAFVTRAVTHGLDKNISMKSTGIPWVKKVPNHWRLLRAKYLFQQTKYPVRDDDEIVTCFRDGQVTLRSNRREDGYTNAVLELGYQGIRVGQLVLHSMDAFAGAIGVSDSDGKCSPEYINCDASDPSISNRYYATLLRVMAKRGFILAACPAVRERAPRIRFSSFAGMLLPVPPSSEQKAIMGQIDSYHAGTSELTKSLSHSVDLLSERRSALITSAVTGEIPIEEMTA